jgi:hypothetical protein
MKRCPDCGEKYSDTYKRCPFCEEEAALRDGGSSRRKSGHRVSQKGPSLLSPVLILVIVLLAGLLIYLLFGDAIRDRRAASSAGSASASASVSAVKPDISGGAAFSSGVASSSSASSSGASSEDQTEPELTYETASALPDGLTLSTTDFTLKTVGETATIRVSGGSGSYTWLSEDEGVASVDDSGKVTAVSKGTVNVLVTDGTKKGVCIVRCNVSGTAAAATQPAETTAHTPATGAKLSKEDFTLPVGDPDVKLTISGVTTAVTWTSKDTSVATVSSDGVVKAVGKGTTTVTAAFDGTTLTCIVRVPR